MHLVGRAKQPEDLENFVNLGIAGEERVAGDHLRNDRAHRPHVNRARVLLRAEQDLRRTVPERDHLVRVRAQRHSERAREAKISELEAEATTLKKEIAALEDKLAAADSGGGGADDTKLTEISALVGELNGTISSFRNDFMHVVDAAEQAKSNDDAEREEGFEMLQEAIDTCSGRSADLKGLVRDLRDQL